MAGPQPLPFPATITPEANHYGIDIHGEIGDPVSAADNGVVVYAGWNDWGYGEMIVIDHGQGWHFFDITVTTFILAPRFITELSSITHQKKSIKPSLGDV